MLRTWRRTFEGGNGTPDTANWVEPTSYALMFLKKFLRSVGQQVPQAGGRETFKPIIAEAESLLYQRMCKEGGWNYGNARVLGEELRPYPLTTAIALHRFAEPIEPECQRSLGYLQRAVAERALGVGSLHGGALSQFVRHPAEPLHAGGHCSIRRNAVFSEHQDLRPGIAGTAVVERE